MISTPKFSVRLAAIGLLIASAGTASCSDSDHPTQPPPVSSQGFSANIGGATFTADSAAEAVLTAAGAYQLVARSKYDRNDLIMLLLSGIKATGKYPLGTYPTVSGGFVQINFGSGIGFNSPTTGAAGELEITTLSPTRIAGRFSVNTIGGATNSLLAVSNGVFDLAMNDVFTPPTASFDTVGGYFRGTVEGTAFNAAGATATLPSGRANRLALLAFNDASGFPSTEINISLENVTAIGTYELDVNALRYMSLTMQRYLQAPPVLANAIPIGAWHSQRAGSSGIVSITSLTASRIAGTVSATLAANGGPISRPIDVEFSFDLPRR